MKNDNLLLQEFAKWDGSDPVVRDQLRAKLYCNRQGVEFDSIVGTVEKGVDQRHILYTDPLDGMPGGGSSFEMAEVDIWPACAVKPRPWWRKALGL